MDVSKTFMFQALGNASAGSSLQEMVNGNTGVGAVMGPPSCVQCLLTPIHDSIVEKSTAVLFSYV